MYAETSFKKNLLRHRYIYVYIYIYIYMYVYILASLSFLDIVKKFSEFIFSISNSRNAVDFTRYKGNRKNADRRIIENDDRNIENEIIAYVVVT